jgi:hypothetical protein
LHPTDASEEINFTAPFRARLPPRDRVLSGPAYQSRQRHPPLPVPPHPCFILDHADPHDACDMPTIRGNDHAS